MRSIDVNIFARLNFLVLLITVLSGCGSGDSGVTESTQATAPSVTQGSNQSADPSGAYSLITTGATAQPADVPENSYLASANQSALLQGPVIGTGALANSTLRRDVSFTNSGTGRNIQPLRVVTTEWYGGGADTTFLTVYFQNTSTELRCGIYSPSAVVTLEDGSTFEASRPGFYGSITERVSNGSLYRACLYPGDIGYLLLDGRTRVADSSAIKSVSIEITDGANISGDFVEIQGTVMPVSYDARNVFNNRFEISITVQNNLDRTISLAVADAFVLDESGLPIGHLLPTYATDEDLILQPGESGLLVGEADVVGQSSSLRVMAFPTAAP